MSLCRRPASVVALVVPLGAAASALAAAARSHHAAQARPAAGAEAAADSEADADQRARRLDRRAARGAGRAGQPDRQAAAAPPIRRASPASASMTAAMLDEGAGGKSALELADAIEFLGADLSDDQLVRLFGGAPVHVPVARLADALPLMADVALAPTFPAERARTPAQGAPDALLQARDDPAAIIADRVSAPRLRRRRIATAPPPAARRPTSRR